MLLPSSSPVTSRSKCSPASPATGCTARHFDACRNNARPRHWRERNPGAAPCWLAAWWFRLSSVCSHARNPCRAGAEPRLGKAVDVSYDDQPPGKAAAFVVGVIKSADVANQRQAASSRRPNPISVCHAEIRALITERYTNPNHPCAERRVRAACGSRVRGGGAAQNSLFWRRLLGAAFPAA